MHKKKLILDFIKQHTLAVISTVTPGRRPEAAILEFGETNNLELIFDALSNSRKYQNLQTNKKVAVVIGWDKDITVQYEGRATELEGKELEECKGVYFSKNPRAKKWETVPEIRYFKVTPTWIRYSDLNKDPWYIFEINL